MKKLQRGGMSVTEQKMKEKNGTTENHAEKPSADGKDVLPGSSDVGEVNAEEHSDEEVRLAEESSERRIERKLTAEKNVENFEYRKVEEKLEREKPKENKMGTMPVRKLIVTMSIPMMISMLVQALYNIVDSIFVAQISEAALTAVSLAFPMQNLMIALVSGTGVGVNALLSKSLGEKRFDRSDAAANTGLLLTFFSFIAFALIGWFGSHWFFTTQTSDPQIIAYGTTYMRIVSCCSLGLFFQVTFERLLQSTGLTIYSMVSQITGAVINLIGDPILIFGLLGAPRLGVTGAAIATCIGQHIAACIGLTLNLKKNKELHFSIDKILKPHGWVIRRIYAVGIPSILMMSIGSVMNYLMNQILIAFSTTATAVFGVYFKLQSFFFMPVFGLNNGIIPVLAYNYGARKRSRIDESLKFALKLAICIMTAGMLVFEIFPGQLLYLFNASKNMLVIGIPALRIIAISFPLAAVGIILGSVFQAFSRSVNSLIISISRQLIVLIPVAWLLAKTGALVNVWWAFPIAEIVSIILSLLLFRRLYRNLIVNL